eukprot:scaffold23312_cov67-Phaeocystis_antarctica.AAC.1
MEAATVYERGCNQVYWRLRPGGLEAASLCTGHQGAHTTGHQGAHTVQLVDPLRVPPQRLAQIAHVGGARHHGRPPAARPAAAATDHNGRWRVERRALRRARC